VSISSVDPLPPSPRRKVGKTVATYRNPLTRLSQQDERGGQRQQSATTS
jgi:hypothetical protein